AGAFGDEDFGEGAALMVPKPRMGSWRGTGVGRPATTFPGKSQTAKGMQVRRKSLCHQSLSTASAVCSNQRCSVMITKTAPASISNQMKHPCMRNLWRGSKWAGDETTA